MKRRGRYYLSRVHKYGQLDSNKIIAAINKPATIVTGKYAWTITDALSYESDDKVLYVFGKLSKFSPEGIVKVVDDRLKVQANVIEPNLIEASSSFVYVPAFEVVAYLHVWNQIEREVFAKRFARIIEETYGSFFAECKLEPITDLRNFSVRLESIDKFIEISAKVHPPNPLFGKAWKSLKEYLDKRAASELSLREKGDERNPLNSRLADHVHGMLVQGAEYSESLDQPIDITDAAVLMAADGYGDGKIVGRDRQTKSTVIIRVSETHRSFLFAADPDAQALFEEANKHIQSINSERGLKHK
jgi:hypothetical protein